MKILIIDRDRDNCEHMQEMLKDSGAEVILEPIKNKAVELMRQQTYDAVFLDPTPQNELRAFIMGVRRTLGTFPPINIMGHDLDRKAVMAAGANDYLAKPFDKDTLLAQVEGSARIVAVSRQMADESEDFPSKDGIIAKSAFNQLYITCLDRADRHGERSFLIFTEVTNLDEIAAADGKDAAAKVADNLRRNISRTRRTSDIAGHIKPAQFCLLLLRPQREDEPFLAAKRFADNLRENHDLISTAPTKAILRVWLLEIPNGAIPAEHIVGADDAAAGSS